MYKTKIVDETNHTYDESGNLYFLSDTSLEWDFKKGPLYKSIYDPCCVRIEHRMIRKIPDNLKNKIKRVISGKSCCDIEETPIVTDTVTYNERLVEAMVRDGWSLSDAIERNIISCERCINALSRKYLGDGFGYNRKSFSYISSPSRCVYCEDLIYDFDLPKDEIALKKYINQVAIVAKKDNNFLKLSDEEQLKLVQLYLDDIYVHYDDSEELLKLKASKVDNDLVVNYEL